MHQRRRWSTSLLASAPLAAGPESLAVVLGYADRPLLVAAVFLIAVGLLPVSTLALYAVPAGLTLLAALFKAGIPFQVMV